MTGRYDGKPFLRLLDGYVLDAIGQLDTAHADGLRGMTPKLREVYGVDGSWQEIVAAQMQLTTGFTDHVRALWASAEAEAQRHGQAADPATFAVQVVDANFPTD